MSAKQEINKYWLDVYQSLENKANIESNTFWQEKRKEAIASFENLGFPTTKHEEWKYTNVAKINKESFKHFLNSKLSAEEIREKSHLSALEGNILTFVNGIWREDLSTILDKAIEIKTLKEAITFHPTEIEKYFSKHTNEKEEAFTALNTAFGFEGTYVYISKNTILDYPVILYHISDAKEENVASHPRNLFVIEENASCTFVEKYDTLGDNISFNNVVSEIHIEANAHVNHYKIQHESVKAYQVNTTQVYQANDSTYKNITISLQGAIIRNNLNIILDGKNAEGYMFGLYMANHKTHIDNHSTVDHKMPHAYSEELYKGILDDHSTGVFNGKIFVRQDAQKTNAYQQNRNILLSDTATINTKPQLEIWADDVKCSHGATTGNLDKESLFYLRSRGIPENEAKSLLISAFAGDILDKIQLTPIKEFIEKIVTLRLDN